MAGKGSSPAGRGPAGNHFEGQIGAYYLLAMLAGAEARGIAGSRIEAVRYQGDSEGFSLDDVVVHAQVAGRPALLEIQAKRTMTFAPADPVFADVMAQVAAARSPEGVDAIDHALAVATARTSQRISGPCQEILTWARTMGDAGSFFRRLASEGVSSAAMRDFVATFRRHLGNAGLSVDDESIWHLLRRFQILEFDFEATAAQAEQHALDRARQLLAHEDAGKARALWSVLIELSISTARTAGVLDLDQTRRQLSARGFILPGENRFTAARARVREMAGHALADMAQDVAGVHLPRQELSASLAQARDRSRFVEIRGGPGVGKSAALRTIAEQMAHEAPILVLDPLRTPSGGWSQLALLLGVTGTARDFLCDLAGGGGTTLFIDSIEMFVDPARRSTVNDLLREAARIDGCRVIVSARDDYDRDEPGWLASDAIDAFGPCERVTVGELSLTEAAYLAAQAPALRSLLTPAHPARAIAGNLYRLARLLTLKTAPETLRTEADLARHWWRSGDGDDVARPERLRLLWALADAAIAGAEGLRDSELDPALFAARGQLAASGTLRESRLGWISFRHDLLRDWAVAARLAGDPDRIVGLELDRPIPATLARGIEMAARLTLEHATDGPAAWGVLLDRLARPRSALSAHSGLTPPGGHPAAPPTEQLPIQLAGQPSSHPSWRRRAILAPVRSENAPALLAQLGERLLAGGGALFIELSNAVIAVDTMSLQSLLDTTARQSGKPSMRVHASLRVATTIAVHHLLGWCIQNGAAIPRQAAMGVLKLASLYLVRPIPDREHLVPVLQLLHRWLMQLDTSMRGEDLPIDGDGEPIATASHFRLVENLRETFLGSSMFAPLEAVTYLKALPASPGGQHKIRDVRRFSEALVRAAPEAFAALIENHLVDSARSEPGWRTSPFGYADSEFMPAWGGQPPFLDLLRAAPETGLGLIHRLLAHAVTHYAKDGKPGTNGLLIAGRFHPWRETYRWARGTSPDQVTASALMALETWAHERISAGEGIDPVLADVLGPEGCCAAFVLVAVDLLISHWPTTRIASVPFVACPELLSEDRTRQSLDEVDGLGAPRRDSERRADDVALRSRRNPLEMLLMEFGRGEHDAHAATLLAKLRLACDRLGDFEPDNDFADPAFMAFHAVNVADPDNWNMHDDAQRYFLPPAREREHLARLHKESRAISHRGNLEAGIRLAVHDPARGSAAFARLVDDHVAGAFPDFSVEQSDDQPAIRVASAALLVARDADDEHLAEREDWIRAALDATLDQHAVRFDDLRTDFVFNPKAIATCTLIHLWCRQRRPADLKRLLELASHEMPFAATAVSAALPPLVAADPRLPKALLRCALSCQETVWPRHDGDGDALVRRQHRLARQRSAAVAAELAWLAGAPEPDWPVFPGTVPVLKDHSARFVPRGRRAPVRCAASVNHQTAAAWLLAVKHSSDPAIAAWLSDIVTAYRRWTLLSNGLGLQRGDELVREPDEWNQAFYNLAGRILLERPVHEQRAFVRGVCALPDESFAAIAPTLLRSVDLVYFTGGPRRTRNAPKVRAAIALRMSQMLEWRRMRLPGDLSASISLAPLVCTVFFSIHNPFARTTSCYVLSAGIERIDAQLDVLVPYLATGPAGYVTECA